MHSGFHRLETWWPEGISTQSRDLNSHCGLLCSYMDAPEGISTQSRDLNTYLAWRRLYLKLPEGISTQSRDLNNAYQKGKTYGYKPEGISTQSRDLNYDTSAGTYSAVVARRHINPVEGFKHRRKDGNWRRYCQKAYQPSRGI